MYAEESALIFFSGMVLVLTFAGLLPFAQGVSKQLVHDLSREVTLLTVLSIDIQCAVLLLFQDAGAPGNTEKSTGRNRHCSWNRKTSIVQGSSKSSLRQCNLQRDPST